MTAILKSIPVNQRAAFVLGIVVLWVTVATLTGSKLPLISSDRAAFLAVAALGFLMCTLALRSTAAQKGFSWLNPFAIAAAVLGTLAIVLAILVLTGRLLLLISGDRQAMLVMAAIILLRWGITFVHQVIL